MAGPIKARILAVAIEQETDIILVRQRTRSIAAALGFDPQDQTRITTAVSEIVRNTLEYGGGGRIEYGISGIAAEQALTIVVEDQGRGIADPKAILEGRHRSTTGMGVGIVGARRLMDGFALDSTLGKGTRVTMAKTLPKRVQPLGTADMKRITAALSTQELADPVAEVRRQNREMLAQLDALNQRQGELNDVNRELQDTNRGVVALYAELEERADHLRRADQLKSRFLSNMSHEFRTPLNSILSLSRLLLSHSDGSLSAEQEKQVQFIRKSAENLIELVNDLLDLAKVEAGKTVVSPRDFLVEDLFSALRGMLRPLLVGDNVALIFEDATDIPPLNTDEGKISQILRNFISNALKFTERGEVRIWAQYDREADTVTFKVKDTGIGIAAKDIDKIWEEFSQVASPIQRRVKGTGLGLPLSRRLAELLRGATSVDSEPGQGSVFSLTVPRRYLPVVEGDGAATRWNLDPACLPVLCVENNAADSFSLERALSRSRYQVLPVRSLAEAEETLSQVMPAAVLLDILLDGEESWRLLIKMRHSERWARVPVIVISTTGEQAKANSFGADGFFEKPIDPAELVRTLDELTGVNSVTKVLVVDDEEVSRYLVRQLLPRGAFMIREAATAVDGLETLQQEMPDVILLDLNMKPMSGFEFLERLGPTSGPPAIVMTSMDVDDELRGRLSGAAQVVSKFDLTTETLVAAIRAAVEARSARPS
jgi:signal transduction histidine kinase/DNA-binding response OmpR family regulator